jgi:CRISPR-associated protein Csb1
MANRLEATCWDSNRDEPVQALTGISHVTVTRKGNFLTDSMLEAHRLNSPYILESSDKTFFSKLRKELGAMEEGPINRKLLAEVLLKYDVGSLIHGVFLAKQELAGGRLRVARALSSFIEATGVSIAASGGVKNDHVNPSGDTSKGFGNVPFARDEFVADEISCYFNLDLNQIRGYGLDIDVQQMILLLALYRIARLLKGDLRLRTACDLEIDTSAPMVTTPSSFHLPSLADLEADVQRAVARCASRMVQEKVKFEDKFVKGKTSDTSTVAQDEENEEGAESEG